MSSWRTKFGVAMLALVGLAAVAGPAQATLVLYDDFNDAAASAGLWASNAVAPGTVTFDGATAILDNPTGDAGGTASMSSGIGMQLNADGDTFRLTWDLTPTFAQFSFFGARIGEPAADQKFMAVARNKKRGRLRAFDAPNPDNSADGVNNTYFSGDALHFDLTATMTDAANNLADLTLKTYARDTALDATPGSYPSGTGVLLETLTVTGAAIDAGQAKIIGFFVGDSVGDAGNSTGGNRGSGVFDNVYSENAVTVVPEPASLVLFGLGLIGMVASRHWRI